MDTENKQTETLDLVGEAGALKDMSDKLKSLEAQNAELLAAKKKYYDAMLNGAEVKEEVPYRSRDEIRKDLFGRDMDSISSRDYAKLVVELDDACIREQGESCFLPKGKNISPTVDERDVAKRMHDSLEYCVSNSENDAEFRSLWARCIKK